MTSGNGNIAAQKQNNKEDPEKSYKDEDEESEKSKTTGKGNIEAEKPLNKEYQMTFFTVTDESLTNEDEESDKSMTNEEEEEMDTKQKKKKKWK